MRRRGKSTPPFRQAPARKRVFSQASSARVKRMFAGATIILTLGMLGVVSPLSASASSGTENFVSMTSQNGEFIGEGKARFFDSANSSISLTGTASHLTVSVGGGSIDPGDHFSLAFAAPLGEQLAAGEYLGAQRFASSGRAGIDINGNGHGCNTIEGRFRVVQLDVDGGGNVTSLWIDYQQNCEGDFSAPLLGEVRYGITGDGGNVLVGPRSIWWPSAQTDALPTSMPVIIFNPGPGSVQMSTSSLAGSDSSNFSILTDECDGLLLLAGDTCKVSLRYSPSTAGSVHASLLIPEASGSTHEVTLDALVSSGKTQFKTQSDPGDFIGQGEDHTYVPSNAQFGVIGTDSSIQVGWVESGGAGWNAVFKAPSGETLTPGTTYHAIRAVSSGSGAGLDVFGDGHGCNTLNGTFTVTDIYIDAYGDVQRFGVQFDQHCEGASPAFHGTLDFQLSDLSIGLGADRVRASGSISPNDPGEQATVTLYRKTSSKFRSIASKQVTLDHSSGFRSNFARPHGGTCKAIVVYSATHSRASKTFSC